MTVKIFSNNSNQTAREELDIVSARLFNLGSTDYYVDSKDKLKNNHPFPHLNTTITLCESLADLSVFDKVLQNCRELIKELKESDVIIDSSCVRLLEIYKTSDNFINDVKSGSDVDITVRDTTPTSSNVTTHSTTVGNTGNHLWRFNDFAMFNNSSRGVTNSSVNKDLNNSGNSSSNGNNGNNTGQLTGSLQDAVKSALDSSNWNAVTDGGNPGIDVDGYPPGNEAQCFDLANYYLKQLNSSWDRTKVDAWGDFNFPLQYKSQLESMGWKLIEYPSFDQLKVGSITFENNQGVGLGEITYGGHTEIITAIEGTTISFLTQNPNSPTIMTVDNGGEPIGWGYRIQLIAVPPGG